MALLFGSDILSLCGIVREAEPLCSGAYAGEAFGAKRLIGLECRPFKAYAFFHAVSAA